MIYSMVALSDDDAVRRPTDRALRITRMINVIDGEELTGELRGNFTVMCSAVPLPCCALLCFALLSFALL